MQGWGGGQGAALASVAIEEIEAGEAEFVQGVPDVLRQISVNGFARDGDAGGPLVGEGINMAEAGVAGVLEVLNDLGGRDAGGGDGFGAGGPDGGDPDGSGEVVPLVGEVEVEELFAGAALAGFAILEGEQGGIADEEGGVGGLEHGFEVRGMFKEAGLNLPEAGKEDAGVGGRGAGGGVERNAGDAVDAVGVTHDEDDGAYAVPGGDGAAGDNGEIGGEGELRDGDESDVGLSRGEFGGALGGSVGGEVVALGEAGAVGLVLEGPHQWSGIKEVNGGDAEMSGGHWSV